MRGTLPSLALNTEAHITQKPRRAFCWRSCARARIPCKSYVPARSLAATSSPATIVNAQRRVLETVGLWGVLQVPFWSEQRHDDGYHRGQFRMHKASKIKTLGRTAWLAEFESDAICKCNRYCRSKSTLYCRRRWLNVFDCRT
jgi:hypothetical protein